MGKRQNEISNILKKNYPKFLTCRNIAEITGNGMPSTSTALKKLKKRNEIEYKMIQGKKPRSGWVTKYRMKGGCE